MSATRVRAYILPRPTGLSGLALREVPRQPNLGPREVRVRVRAASLNYRDLLIVRGDYAALTLPDLIPLCDGAGEVQEIGAEVWSVRPGDRVSLVMYRDWLGGPWRPSPNILGRGGSTHGVLCEECVVEENELVKAPAHLDDVQVATLPCAAVTAWSALTDLAPLLPGETVIVQGTGGVAIFALQFAKLFGAQVIATTSTPQKADVLSALGADYVINYSATPNWSNEVMRLTEGMGADLTVDLGGAATYAQSIEATKVGGRLALVGLLGGPPKADGSLFQRGLRQSLIRVGSRNTFIEMNRAIAYHRLRAVVDRVFDFDAANEAFEYFARRQHIGKVVIRVAD